METLVIVDVYTLKGGAVYPLSCFEKKTCLERIGNDRIVYVFVRALFKKNL